MKKLIKSKWIIIVLLAVFFTSFQPQKVEACEIKFEITENKKDVYNIGDIIVVKVKIILTHRACPISIKDTKFTMKGLKVIGATEWTQLSTMVWERKLKMKVNGTKNGKLVLNAIRTCDKDGGFGSLKLNSNPIK